MISKYIILPIFIISFIVGLFLIQIIGPEIKTIYIYPTPVNFKTIQYKDNANQCFNFIPKEIKCPFNPLLIKTIPIQ